MKNREKRMKSGQSLRPLCKIGVTRVGVYGGEGEKRAEKLSEEITAENFPDLI